MSRAKDPVRAALEDLSAIAQREPRLREALAGGELTLVHIRQGRRETVGAQIPPDPAPDNWALTTYLGLRHHTMGGEDAWDWILAPEATQGKEKPRPVEKGEGVA